jgi:hypothetical protein
MSKSDYLSSLLFRRMYYKEIREAALIYWHSGIPLLNATIYLDRLEAKLHTKKYGNLRKT